jgi:long-chain acyl-CoA synthetase
VPDIHNLADAVRRSASTAPEAPALVVPAGPGTAELVITWGDLDARVDAVAAGLRRLELPHDGAGARVAIGLPNVPEFADVFFGALRAGLVAVPINPGYTPRELRQLLKDSGAAAMVAAPDVAARLAEVRADLPGLRHLYVTGDGTLEGTLPFADLVERRDDASAGASASASTGDEDLAVLVYTSGTAGTPKGAMLSHRALIANHRQLAAVEPAIIRSGDVVLLALPLFHAFGLNSALGAIAWHGACGVLVDSFDPRATLAVISRHQVSVLAAVPQMYAAWATVPDLGERVASVRVAVSGAAPLDQVAARRFLDVTSKPIFEGYGLTETAPVVATALASPVPKAGSIGRPIPEVEIKLVAGDGTEIARVGPDGLLFEDEYDDDFDDVAGGAPGTDPGEIVVRGPNLFSGYWPDGRGGPDGDGWWATGDVAYADVDGDLFLVDRLGELIIVSGFNVYPHEVELVLAAFPGVAEAAVVPMADPTTGQAVRAYVVLAADATVTEADLAGHCARNLARFKCPAVIEFVPELPHTATGKVVKGSLGRS